MQQYDQRRLRLFAVVLFLGIMAANLGRYLIFDGLYLWDARLRWQECAYVLHGLNPFDVLTTRFELTTYYKDLFKHIGLYEENKYRLNKFFFGVAES